MAADGKRFVVVEIKAGEETPYYTFVKGHRDAFVRIGNQSVKANAIQLKRLVLKSERQSWDSLPSKHLRSEESFEVLRSVYRKRTLHKSPGGMPSGELIQDLDAHYVPSTRRNPVIADLFQRLDLMERRGSGFGKIIDAYKAESDKRGIGIQPSFRSSATAFFVILPNLNYGLKAGSTTTVTTTDTVTKTVTKTGVKTVTKGVAKGGGDRHVQEGIFVDTPTIAELLGKDTAKVYRLLLQDGGMTISDMAKKLRLSSRGVRYHIEKIKNANLLRRVGGRKFGHWEVVK